MTSPSLTVDTPAGPVRATAGPRQDNAVVFELGGAMRGSVHVTSTPPLGPVHRRTRVPRPRQRLPAHRPRRRPTAAHPRLARGRTRYHGSLTLCPDDRPQVSVYPMTSIDGHEPPERTAATLTAVLRACAAHVAQRDDLSSAQEPSGPRA
ncbi:hypothetical protein [Streptomyces adustus]|uniref:hypothetical protein n=1 Tax=Streptomyces adustus TaxID=1609272 RepID=UPI001EE4019F|nr:hypothetical protein [Streptomyces adustus]